ALSSRSSVLRVPASTLFPYTTLFRSFRKLYEVISDEKVGTKSFQPDDVQFPLKSLSKDRISCIITILKSFPGTGDQHIPIVGYTPGKVFFIFVYSEVDIEST